MNKNQVASIVQSDFQALEDVLRKGSDRSSYIRDNIGHISFWQNSAEEREATDPLRFRTLEKFPK